MIPRNRGGHDSKASSADDEKMFKIVDEVDRFFQSVHADIEDWKFSMEDYGDGTRIFVRFQIHINKSLGGLNSEKPTSLAPPMDKDHIPSNGDGSDIGGTHPGGVNIEGSLSKLEASGDNRRANQDLASFVDLWRHKREVNQSGEFHKEGAPFMETQPEWTGQKRANEVERNPREVGTAPKKAKRSAARKHSPTQDE
jgi:hypothetical protein